MTEVRFPVPGKRLFTLSLALLLLTACSRSSPDLLLAETGWTARLPKGYQRAPFPESDGSLVHRCQREAIEDDSGFAVHPNISFSIDSIFPHVQSEFRSVMKYPTHPGV